MTNLRRTRRAARCPIGLLVVLVLLAVFGSGARETLAEARLGASSPRPRSHSTPSPEARFFLECDRGQLPDGAAFRARGVAATVLLDGDGLAFAANGAAGSESGVRLSFGGLGPLVWKGRDSLSARGSSFVGSDPADWRTGIPLFGAAAARDERTGVEVRFGGENGRPAYSFSLPAGSPDAVPSLRFDGASRVEIDGRGDLAVVVPSGRWTHSAPRAFEETSRGTCEVPCRFVVAGRGEVRIDVERRDRAAALFIDPRVDFANTYGVPVWQENVSRVSVDGQGRLAVAYAATEPIPKPYNGRPLRSTVVVLRMDASGRRVLWTTTIGSGQGGGAEEVGGVVARDSGAVLVAGDTRRASGFPRVGPVFDFAGYGTDAFVCQIAPGGGSLEFSSIYGGTGWGTEYYDQGHMGDDFVSGACVAGDGTLVVVGKTDSIDLPVVGGHARASGGAFDGFVLRLAPDGRSVVHAGHLGGAGWDYVWGVAPGPNGSVYVAGPTGSADFPLLDPIAGVSGTGDDAFVTRLSSVGEITWSTKLGGSYDDAAGPIAVAKDGTVYVAGWAAWTDFPAVGPGPFGPRGRADLFVAHLDPAAHTLLQSVVFGGSDLEDVAAMCIDPSGRVWLTGDTDSGDFPALNAVSTDPGGAAHGSFVPFVAEFSADCDLVSSGYVWGAGYGLGGSIVAGGAGLAWLGGQTYDANFPFADAPSGTGIEAGYAYLVAVGSGPGRPQPVTATSAAAGSANLEWGHDGAGVAGFVVERSDDGAPFHVVARPTADARSVAEENLMPGTALVYRVRAVASSGDESRWSEEAKVVLVVPTTTPAPPTGLSASPVAGGHLRITWTDASDDETWFEVERSRSGEPATIVALLPVGSTTWTDDAPAPDRSAAYRVRSGNDVGPSAWSGPAYFTTPATLVVAISRGGIRWRGTSPRGSVHLSGTIVREAGAPYDVRAGGLTLHLKGWEGPVLIDVPAGDGAWKRSHGRFTWRTPRRVSPRVVVTIAPATGKISIDVTRVAPPPIEPGLVRISAGNAVDGGSDERTWRKKGRTLVLR